MYGRNNGICLRRFFYVKILSGNLSRLGHCIQESINQYYHHYPSFYFSIHTIKERTERSPNGTPEAMSFHSPTSLKGVSAPETLSCEDKISLGTGTLSPDGSVSFTPSPQKSKELETDKWKSAPEADEIFLSKLAANWFNDAPKKNSSFLLQPRSTLRSEESYPKIHHATVDPPPKNKAALTITGSTSSKPDMNPPAKNSGLTIIGAGCGRTGTTSLKEALEILGFGPCYHMTEVFKDPSGVSKWEKVADFQNDGVSTKGILGKKWDEIFMGYQSTTDFPAALYYKELLQHYPNAKVILTVRDEEKWAASVGETILPASLIWTGLHRLAGTENVRFSNMVSSVVWTKFCGGSRQARNRPLLLEAFRKHNQEVQAAVPSDQLLVFEVKEGWEKLCKFLGKPVPKTPFPHKNDTPQFQAMIHARRKRTVKRLLLGAAALGISVWLGIKSTTREKTNQRL